MTTARETAQESRTYSSRCVSRANEIGGAVDLTYTDTIFADGLIISTVKGTADGEYVNKRTMRRIAKDGPLKADRTADFERIHAARISSGWVLR